MNRGGRPLHKYWEEGKYEKRYEGKKQFAYCMICKKTIRHTAESRLRDHRRSCQEPLIDDEEFEEVIINVNRDESDTNTTIHSDLDSIMLNVTNEENLENTDASATSSSNAIQIQLPKRSVLRPIDNNGQNKKALSSKKRKQIDEFIDKISCAEKVAIDNSFITFLCGCNIPFDILNSTHFKKFVKLLRPAYEHPSKNDDLCMSTNRDNNPWFFKCQATVTMKIVSLFKTIPFISKVRSVLNGFQTPRLKEEIINRGGVEFEVVTDEASIFSIKDMFINCLKNQLIFEQILTEHVFRIPNDVITILFDTDTVLPSSNATSFEKELKKFISLCEYICSLISKCQRPCSTMCDIIEQWLEIESIVAGDNSMTEIHNEICAILSPISIVANCLHPVYRGLKFEHNPERNLEILEYLLTVLDDRRLDDFYEYSQKRGLFEKIEKQN
ncbi:hypothetical protein DBV15_12638 [Temnothorax longispinosus]|uniref:BED-type domain-containing protein n=1 Tax=Temnothorax longispinosus TaxID=300112 RepID=A0A4S2KP74_9HYME|nr:hypothetical protein DBV15_12638 [Temnothorax longispinosus]